MKILVTGQTTLHWGRMEFGNIGNYYITEPFFAELREQFPDAIIRTTFQLSKKFVKKYFLEILPMEIYYDFNRLDNLQTAQMELFQAEQISSGVSCEVRSDYVQNVVWCDLFIDLSGDLWGDNADFLGKDRFEVGLIKDRIAQILKKKTAMLAGSPGPFSRKKIYEFLKTVYEGFDLVTNREEISTLLLQELDISCKNTIHYPCPSFLYSSDKNYEADCVLVNSSLRNDNRPIVGFIVCGWNFENPPFDRWPRDESEYNNFVNFIDEFTKRNGVKICLLSHSNGFPIPPKKFELLHGRDYPIIKQLQTILLEKGIECFSLDGVYYPDVTKAIIAKFDMLISGRVHGAVAALSQGVPTVIIDYGHEPKAHKLRGFAKVVGQEEYIVNPANVEEMIKKAQQCWDDRLNIHEELINCMPFIREKAKANFSILKNILNED